MTKQRLEAFTDGVVAIIITIMVLDMKVPAGSGAVRTNEGDMTRYVLLVGALFAGLFTLMWPVFTLLPSLPDTGVAPFDSILHSLRIFAAINGYNEHSPFTGTGPLFKLWFVCLLIAVVSDRAIKPPARAVVSACAAALSPEAGQAACEIQQDVGWKADGASSHQCLPTRCSEGAHAHN